MDFIIVNESYPTSIASSCGYIKKETNEFITDFCSHKKDKPRVFIGHYPLIEPFSFSRMRRRLWGQNDVVKLLNNKNIDLSLCGHIHHPFDILDDDGKGETCSGSITKTGCLTKIIYDDKKDTFTHTRHSI